MTRRPPPKRSGSPRAFETRSAADAIIDALAIHGLSDEIRAQRVIAEWGDLVGPKVAARTRPDRIVDRILYVEVATSAWLQELNLLKAQLVMGLTSRLGDPRLFDDVRFKLAGRTRREAVTTPAPRPKPPGPLAPGKPASGATREQIVSEVSAVDDEELRELIARVRIANDR
ncbi:MAG: DUF721 domain-containing protein [Myxococcales bacterium]|nr:DUF721 domain-containing protein [Myxococcales bacterium]